MARFNYEDLNEETQRKLQEETGLTHKELLAGKTQHTPEAEKETGYNPMDKSLPPREDWWLAVDKGFRFIKHKPASFWGVFLPIASFILVILGIVFLIATIATSC